MQVGWSALGSFTGETASDVHVIISSAQLALCQVGSYDLGALKDLLFGR